MSLDDLKQRSDFDSCNLFYRFPHSPKPKKPSQDLPVPTPVDGSQSEDRDQEKRKKKVPGIKISIFFVEVLMS